MKRAPSAAGKRPGRLNLRRNWQKHALMLPAIILIFIFSYIPMVGIVIAFQQYLPTKGYFGSPWVGLDNFKYMFQLPNVGKVITNTLFISFLKIVTVLAAAVLFALFLNEIRVRWLRTGIQSMALFPFFLSWVTLGGIVKDIVAYDGMINNALASVGLAQVPFLSNSGWFTFMLVFSNIWKEMGYNAIIILAALTAIDPALYEAATIDGATRMQKLRYVTLPGIAQVVAMLLILALGGILNGGFDQIYNLYNTLVMPDVDIIDTYVFRIGVLGGQYGLGTAVGLFKSVVGFILLSVSYKAADRYAGYRIF